MSKLTKKQKVAVTKVDADKMYALADAMVVVKDANYAKFDSSVDVHIRLGVDQRKPHNKKKKTVSLPHGTGKSKTVAVFCTPEKEAEAMEAGADYVGLDELIEKVAGGWTDVDVVIAMPGVMAKMGKIARILGPRGLMPNPKTGTVTVDVGSAVTEVKKGKISFRVDKYGIIHSSVGRISFTPENLVENATELITTLQRMKPSSAKGAYFKSITVATTMSPGVKIDTKSLK